MQLKEQIHLSKLARRKGYFCVLGEPDSIGVAQLGAVLINGPDAAEFLHGQVTNEVKNLKQGTGNNSARVTQKGALYRLFSMHRIDNESFMLLLERNLITGLCADLKRYLFSEAMIKDVSEDYEWWTVQGEISHKVMDNIFGSESFSWLRMNEHQVHEVQGEFIPTGTLIFMRSLTGDIGFVIAVPKANRSSTLGHRLGEVIRNLELLLLEGTYANDVLESLRIEAGVVRIGKAQAEGIDLIEGQRVLPQVGLEQRVASYNKGCYLGQEIIARIRTYGAVRYVLRGLIFEEFSIENLSACEDLLNQLPAAGESLFLQDGKKVGEIASRTLSTVTQTPIAYAFLDPTHRTPGTLLVLRGIGGERLFKARVVLLPFYAAPDAQARVAYLHDRAIRFFSQHRDLEAIALLEEALRIDPSFKDAYEALGVILGRSERYHEAIDLFKRLEELAPNEPMVHTNLSLFYMRLGDKESAETEKTKATVKQFGKFADEAAAKQAAEQERLQRQDEAHRKIGMFMEVLEIDPTDPIALFGLGNAYLTLDQLEEAAKYLKRALEVQQDNSPVYLIYGKVLEKLNKSAEAIAIYRKGLEVASKKGDLMPLKEMEHRMLLLGA